MKKAILISSAALGALAYFVRREYTKSDHSFKVPCRPQRGFEASAWRPRGQGAQRFVSAVRAGIEDWGTEAYCLVRRTRSR